MTLYNKRVIFAMILRDLKGFKEVLRDLEGSKGLSSQSLLENASVNVVCHICIYNRIYTVVLR